MSRIGAQPGGALAKVVLKLARRKTRQLTGKETERMIEPLEAYALVPGLMLGYGMLEMATARQARVPERLKVLAELKAATLTNCEYCIDIGSQIARRAGLSDAQLLALPRYSDSDLFDELEKLVLDYAVAVSRTPVAVSDELFEELQRHFADARLVELTNIIAVENMRARFNLALGIGSAKFSEGMVCAVPEPAATAGPAPAARTLHAPAAAASSR